MPRVKGQLGPPLRDHQIREGTVCLAEVKAAGRRAWVRVVVVEEGVPAGGVRRWVLRADAEGERRGPSLMPRPASQLRAAPPATESQLPVLACGGEP